ncbi:MAG: hypothetical protein U9O94_00760 [Nanoarchaeota archaeon]|nr:hypothetical protein [Nanoarchaeota archaeon]
MSKIKFKKSKTFIECEKLLNEFRISCEKNNINSFYKERGILDTLEAVSQGLNSIQEIDAFTALLRAETVRIRLRGGDDE